MPTDAAVLGLRNTSNAAWLAVLPDGKLLASASFDGTVRLWDTTTWKEQQSLEAHPSGVQCVAFAPDSKTLATCNHHDDRSGAAVGAIALSGKS